MSKNVKLFYQSVVATALVLQIFTFAAGQGTATVEFEGQTARVAVETVESRNLSFVRSYAGIDGVADRISGLKLMDAAGGEVPYRTLAPGEHIAEGPFRHAEYDLDLTPRSGAGRVHLSWFDGTIGVLRSDLLPLAKDGWSVQVEGAGADGEHRLEAHPSPPIFLGSGWRKVVAADRKITVMLSGEWLFTDEEALARSVEIFDDQLKLFGSLPEGPFTVAFVRLPKLTAFGEWHAETRGGTAVIASSDMPFRTPSVQRMHEQLRHEIFHFWIPNGVNLGGNYDWFYEGFALYQSLKSGVRLKRIRFEDMLITLSQAMRMADAVGDNVSLIDATRNRWTPGQNAIYARGMATAFYIDLAMMNASSGRRRTDDIVREVYAKYSGAAERQDGNVAVLEILNTRPEVRPIVSGIISGTSGFDADGLLTQIGFVRTPGKLEIVEKPSGRQREILRRLGYNGR